MLNTLHVNASEVVCCRRLLCECRCSHLSGLQVGVVDEAPRYLKPHRLITGALQETPAGDSGT
jgi:hypothetical protein